MACGLNCEHLYQLSHGRELKAARGTNFSVLSQRKRTHSRFGWLQVRDPVTLPHVRPTTDKPAGIPQGCAFRLVPSPCPGSVSPGLRRGCAAKPSERELERQVSDLAANTVPVPPSPTT